MKSSSPLTRNASAVAEYLEAGGGCLTVLRLVRLARMLEFHREEGGESPGEKDCARAEDGVSDVVGLFMAALGEGIGVFVEVRLEQADRDPKQKTSSQQTGLEGIIPIAWVLRVSWYKAETKDWAQGVAAFGPAAFQTCASDGAQFLPFSEMAKQNEVVRCPTVVDA